MKKRNEQKKKKKDKTYEKKKHKTKQNTSSQQRPFSGPILTSFVHRILPLLVALPMLKATGSSIALRFDTAVPTQRG